MSAPVFLAEPGSLADARAGALHLLDGAEGRHAGVVQRRSPGERVDVVDGRGVRLECVVEGAQPDGVQLRVQARVEEPAPGVALVLVQALAKGDRDELAIEAATEVGVDAVVPWQAERSVVVWRGERAAKSRARWLGTVRAAAKQSRRAWVPEVGTALDDRGLVARVQETARRGGLTLVLHEEASTPLASVALPAPGAAGEPVELVVVVGPEGGISQREVDALTEAGAVTVRLGPHVLRTSTAGPVALALLAERLGRWS
ncbi:16S rRNA (uracil(1498)-N(3))-methyltransferase [Cellulomonas cellasea]|uniref:Ribosomal RNA small subunit methyltransferase E n=2 Tax=Cellulomonas cellasea TaxID=43670 RepID=A0A0A0B987_9CELL|nr:16S rRNA (uracil(1498)-N(3))-methyltransferase [Cellulomonas cellasea]KGM02364.1 16S rRNA methyltransferase [Cellulomonas cellasea DSM 20118]GEA89283.1 ribosomal RNA small subunit methyltransferase E [Cellulomonas cellasea]